jgi:hypothetical protein
MEKSSTAQGESKTISCNSHNLWSVEDEAKSLILGRVTWNAFLQPFWDTLYLRKHLSPQCRMSNITWPLHFACFISKLKFATVNLITFGFNLSCQYHVKPKSSDSYDAQESKSRARRPRNSKHCDQVDTELHYHLADGAIAFVNSKKWVSSERRSQILEAGTEAFCLVPGEWLISQTSYKSPLDAGRCLWRWKVNELVETLRQQ